MHRIFVDLAMSPEVLAHLRAETAGHEIILPAKPVSSVLAKGDLDPQFAAADIAFGQPDVEAITGAPNLKWVHVSSSGITRYDTAEFRALAAERSLPVSNSAQVYHEDCAVHALSFMVAQARQLPNALGSQIANGSAPWNAMRNACRSLRGETVLILGYGAIGSRLAELLAPFGAKVLAYRRKARGDEKVPVVTDANLASVLEQTDHVVNILPESNETRRFFNAERFAGMKSGAVFYNIGRGATVDQDALVAALRSGQVGAAWLDVTEPEPLPADHPLRAEPNCQITPHIAGGHRNETLSLVNHFLENFRRFTSGRPLVDRVM